MSELITRSVALADAPLEVARSGDGRTICGYVAVFETPAEIHDVHGDYLEQNARGAFNKSIADRGTKFLVTYNHGRTLYGTPSEMGSIPLGVPTAVRADGRGVYAEIAVDRHPLGDMVLEGARSGSIPGMSYIGGLIKSNPERPRGGYRVDRGGKLPLVTRHEINMREFGPTPTPTFDAAAIIGVRALVASIDGLDQAQRAELIALLSEAQELRSATRSEPADLGTSPEAAESDEPPQALRSEPSVVDPRHRISRARRAVTVLRKEAS